MQETPSFETLLEQIKQSISKLEKDDVLLEDAIKEYKNGSKLIKQASEMLEQARLTYDELNAQASENQ